LLVEADRVLVVHHLARGAVQWRNRDEIDGEQAIPAIRAGVLCLAITGAFVWAQPSPGSREARTQLAAGRVALQGGDSLGDSALAEADSRQAIELDLNFVEAHDSLLSAMSGAPEQSCASEAR
jgi:hypothetical protein